MTFPHVLSALSAQYVAFRMEFSSRQYYIENIENVGNITQANTLNAIFSIGVSKVCNLSLELFAKCAKRCPPTLTRRAHKYVTFTCMYVALACVANITLTVLTIKRSAKDFHVWRKRRRRGHDEIFTLMESWN